MVSAGSAGPEMVHSDWLVEERSDLTDLERSKCSFLTFCKSVRSAMVLEMLRSDWSILIEVKNVQIERNCDVLKCCNLIGR